MPISYDEIFSEAAPRRDMDSLFDEASGSVAVDTKPRVDWDSLFEEPADTAAAITSRQKIAEIQGQPYGPVEAGLRGFASDIWRPVKRAGKAMAPALGGGAVGAGIGSVVPGVGTALGFAGGAAMGILGQGMNEQGKRGQAELQRRGVTDPSFAQGVEAQFRQFHPVAAPTSVVGGSMIGAAAPGVGNMAAKAGLPVAKEFGANIAVDIIDAFTTGAADTYLNHPDPNVRDFAKNIGARLAISGTLSGGSALATKQANPIRSAEIVGNERVPVRELPEPQKALPQPPPSRMPPREVREPEFAPTEGQFLNLSMADPEQRALAQQMYARSPEDLEIVTEMLRKHEAKNINLDDVAREMARREEGLPREGLIESARRRESARRAAEAPPPPPPPLKSDFEVTVEETELSGSLARLRGMKRKELVTEAKRLGGETTQKSDTLRSEIEARYRNETGIERGGGRVEEKRQEVLSGPTQPETTTTKPPVSRGVETPTPEPAAKKPSPADDDLEVHGFGLGTLNDKLNESVREGARAVSQVGRRIFQRGTSFIERHGMAGKQMSSDLKDINFQAQRRKNTNLLDAQAALRGFSRDEVDQAMKYMNGREGGKAASGRVKTLAETVRGILDRDMSLARELGFERKLKSGEKISVGGSGKAFPQVPSEKGEAILKAAKERGASDPRVFRVAEKMVESGKAGSIEQAVKRLVDFHDQRQLRPVHGYFERTRIELPEDMVEWSPSKVLPSLFEKNALLLEGARKWGPDLEGGISLSQALDADSGTKDQVKEFLQHEFGLKRNASADSRVAGAISNYETAVRLSSPLSALRNVGQRFVNTAKYPLSASAKAMRDAPPIVSRFMKENEKLVESLQRRGAIDSGPSALSEMERSGKSLAESTLKATGFSAAERGNQVHAALVAKYAAEHDAVFLARYQKSGAFRKGLDRVLALSVDPEGAARRRLKNAALTELSDERIDEIIAKGGLTDEQIDAAMHRAVQDTQFPQNLASKRLWWSKHPWARLAAKFKTYAVEQTALVYRDVLKEAALGNFAPLVKFTTASLLVGEMYNLARDFVTGKEESTTLRLKNDPMRRTGKEIGKALLNDIVDGGGFGMIVDITYGLGNYAVGPVGTSAKNIGRAIIGAARNPEIADAAAKELFAREVTVARQAGVSGRRLNDLVRGVADDRGEYERVRSKAREFAHDKRLPTTGEKAEEIFSNIVQGRPVTIEGKKSLPYDYAARAITMKDHEKAVRYIRAVLNDADSPKERRRLLDGIRSSMRSRSPLGPVPNKNMSEFMRSVAPERRVAMRQLDADWRRRYERAIAEAMKAESFGRPFKKAPPLTRPAAP